MRIACTVALLAIITPASWAGNMVFQFVTPNFGGNPNNGAFLLNKAQAQNSYKAPGGDDYGYSAPSALDNFTSAIQSQLLSGLLGNVATGKPGRLVTNDFIVDIKNSNGLLTLNVTDRSTGKTSTIQVSGVTQTASDE